MLMYLIIIPVTTHKCVPTYNTAAFSSKQMLSNKSIYIKQENKIDEAYELKRNIGRLSRDNKFSEKNLNIES